MKVLYIVGGEGNRYGSEIIAIDLISAGKQNGIDYSVVAANKGAVTDACEELGIEYHVFPFTFFVYKALDNKVLDFVKKTIWKSRAEFLTKRATRSIEKAIDFSRIDIIHTNLSRDLLGGFLAKRNGIPHVWHIQELLNAHYQLRFLKKDQIAWMTGHANRFIAISQTVAEEWINGGLQREKVKVIQNGIDLSSIIPKESYATDEMMRMVMVGHIVPAKGQEKILQEMSRLSNEVKEAIAIDFYGEGTKDYKEKLIHLAKQNNLNATMKGYCADIGKLLKDYDIGINCSRGEGFGLSTVEYMAAGICPVVANTGANEEIIRNGHNGYVFDYYTENSFGELLKELIKVKDRCVSASKQAREDAISFYSLKKMRNEVFQTYKDVRDSVKDVEV